MTSLIDNVARAIYTTHWRAPSPVWENASQNVRNWVRAQAWNAVVATLADSELTTVDLDDATERGAPSGETGKAAES